MKRQCSKCKVGFTSENSAPSVIERGRGLCNSCSAERSKSDRVKNPKAFILYRVRGNAKVRGLECTLEIEDIPDIPEFCPILPWIQIRYRIGSGKRRKDYWDSPSLDRINNKVGYVKGNVRIISFRANIIKSDASDEELIALGKDAEARSA